MYNCRGHVIYSFSARHSHSLNSLTIHNATHNNAQQRTDPRLAAQCPQEAKGGGGRSSHVQTHTTVRIHWETTTVFFYCLSGAQLVI